MLGIGSRIGTLSFSVFAMPLPTVVMLHMIENPA